LYCTYLNPLERFVELFLSEPVKLGRINNWSKFILADTWRATIAAPVDSGKLFHEASCIGFDEIEISCNTFT